MYKWNCCNDDSFETKPGDEVLTSPMTFVSVIHAFELLKLKVKLVDINLINFSLDYDLLNKIYLKKSSN